jgi:L-ascorbate metabolism protein UlaG (beta-lactamase superfamily)
VSPSPEGDDVPLVEGPWCAAEGNKNPVSHRDKRARRRRRRRKVAWAALRSGLSRYPGVVLASLRRRGAAGPGPRLAALESLEEHGLAATWLGHATVLARLGQLNVLVDPVFSDRIGMRIGKVTVGPKRLEQVPVAPEGLPHVDLVLITHAHFDHLDRPSLRRLARPETIVVTAHRTRRLIPRGFGAVLELRAGRSVTIRGLRIEAIKAAHWGARKLVDQHRRWNSYLVESAEGRILFAGDTAMTRAFDGLEQVDLAVFGIGAYDPWENMHATPEQVWAMFARSGAERLLPVHHSTFQLSDEPLDEPMRRLLAAADGQAGQIVQVAPGELWVGREHRRKSGA